jgi:hypothetical protein
MSSRDGGSDPECPECGGPISATSSYCMHCGAEFDDGSDTGTGRRSHEETGPSRDAPGEGGLAAKIGDVFSNEGHQPGDDERYGSSESDHDRDRHTHEQAESDAAVQAPLWMRVFTGFFVSIPVTFVASIIVLALVDQVSGSTGGFLLLAIWVGTFGYLVRKPLPSDIIGDAFYTLAGLLLIGPVLGYAMIVGRAVVTAGTLADGLGNLVVQLVFIEFTLLWPAGLLATFGYAFNWWAKKKLRKAADPGQGRTSEG